MNARLVILEEAAVIVFRKCLYTGALHTALIFPDGAIVAEAGILPSGELLVDDR
jgi:hypothetical protein